MATEKVKKDEAEKPKKSKLKKVVAKSATTTKKAVATKKVATAKKAVKEPVSKNDDIPVDLRAQRRVGRPSNKERASVEKIDEDLRLLCSSWLKELLGEKGKKIPVEMKARLLPNLMRMIERDDADQQDDEKNATRELLGQKYLTLRAASISAEEASREAAKGT